MATAARCESKIVLSLGKFCCTQTSIYRFTLITKIRGTVDNKCQLVFATITTLSGLKENGKFAKCNEITDMAVKGKFKKYNLAAVQDMRGC